MALPTTLRCRWSPRRSAAPRVIVAPSLNQPLLDHPMAQASLRTLPAWGVTIVPPADAGEGPRLAPSTLLLDAVRPYVRLG